MNDSNASATNAKFKENQLVWAKQPECLWWPGVIYDNTPNFILVIFLGEKRHSEPLPDENVIEFTSQLGLKKRKAAKKVNKMKYALRLADKIKEGEIQFSDPEELYKYARGAKKDHNAKTRVSTKGTQKGKGKRSSGIQRRIKSTVNEDSKVKLLGKKRKRSSNRATTKLTQENEEEECIPDNKETVEETESKTDFHIESKEEQEEHEEEEEVTLKEENIFEDLDMDISINKKTKINELEDNINQEDQLKEENSVNAISNINSLNNSMFLENTTPTEKKIIPDLDHSPSHEEENKMLPEDYQLAKQDNFIISNNDSRENNSELENFRCALQDNYNTLEGSIISVKEHMNSFSFPICDLQTKDENSLKSSLEKLKEMLKVIRNLNSFPSMRVIIQEILEKIKSSVNLIFLKTPQISKLIWEIVWLIKDIPKVNPNTDNNLNFTKSFENMETEQGVKACKYLYYFMCEAADKIFKLDKIKEFSSEEEFYQKVIKGDFLRTQINKFKSIKGSTNLVGLRQTFKDIFPSILSKSLKNLRFLSGLFIQNLSAYYELLIWKKDQSVSLTYENLVAELYDLIKFYVLKRNEFSYDG